MVLDELLNSAKQSLLERLASPLLGGFAVAWCVWNWKFLIIVLSSNTVTQTIALVDKIAFPDLTCIATRGFLYPLLSALFYVFLYPYPARVVYEFTLPRQREVNATRQRIADETPLTLEESRALRGEFVERERKHSEQIRSLNEEIGRLNAILDKPAADAPRADASTPQSQGQVIESGQIEMLELLEKVGSPALEEELIKRSKKPKVKAEFDLGELRRLKLLHRNYDGSRRGYTLEFTHDGRKVLLSHRTPES